MNGSSQNSEDTYFGTENDPFNPVSMETRIF